MTCPPRSGPRSAATCAATCRSSSTPSRPRISRIRPPASTTRTTSTSPGFIDHNLLNAIFKNVDSLRLSAYFYKERGGKVVAGPLWDMDLSSGTPYDDQFGRRTGDPREWARGRRHRPAPLRVLGPALQRPRLPGGLQQALGRAARQHLLGRPHPRGDRQVRRRAPGGRGRHFAKWTEYRPNGGSHDNEIRILKDLVRRPHPLDGRRTGLTLTPRPTARAAGVPLPDPLPAQTRGEGQPASAQTGAPLRQPAGCPSHVWIRSGPHLSHRGEVGRVCAGRVRGAAAKGSTTPPAAPDATVR